MHDDLHADFVQACERDLRTAASDDALRPPVLAQSLRDQFDDATLGFVMLTVRRARVVDARWKPGALALGRADARRVLLNVVSDAPGGGGRRARPAPEVRVTRAERAGGRSAPPLVWEEAHFVPPSARKVLFALVDRPSDRHALLKAHGFAELSLAPLRSARAPDEAELSLALAAAPLYGAMEDVDGHIISDEHATPRRDELLGLPSSPRWIGVAAPRAPAAAARARQPSLPPPPPRDPPVEFEGRDGDARDAEPVAADAYAVVADAPAPAASAPEAPAPAPPAVAAADAFADDGDGDGDGPDIDFADLSSAQDASVITPASLKAGLGRAGVKLRRHECLELFSEYDTEMRGRLGEDAAAGLIARVRAGEFGGVADAAGRDGYVREAPPPPPSSPFKSAADDGAGAAAAETGTLAIGVLKGAKLAKKMLALLTRGVACKLVERDDDGDDADVFARADAGFARADARGGGGGGGARASSFAFDVSASLGCDLELLPTRLCGCGSEVDDEAACAELAGCGELADGGCLGAAREEEPPPKANSHREAMKRARAARAGGAAPASPTQPAAQPQRARDGDGASDEPFSGYLWLTPTLSHIQWGPTLEPSARLATAELVDVEPPRVDEASGRAWLTIRSAARGRGSWRLLVSDLGWAEMTQWAAALRWLVAARAAGKIPLPLTT